MTPEEIIAGNKTIAEFMGLKENPYDGGKTFGVDAFEKNGRWYAEDWIIPKYERSWNELIPVVQKIKSLPIAEQDTEIRQKFTENIASILWEEIAHTLACVNIEMVWEKVIEFIEWHNKQKA